MKVYLDTSVILRKILGEDAPLEEWGLWDQGYTSAITRVEALRALDRLRLQGGIDDAEVAEKVQLLREVLDATGIISVNQAVLDRAAQSYPTVVGTLDAIHLASALIYTEQKKEPLVFLTHDHRLALASKALGFETGFGERFPNLGD